MKLISFSITEITGRTFELPVDKAKEIIETMKANEPECLKYAKVDYNDCSSVADFLATYCLDDMCKYELDNSYYETQLIDETFIESEN